MTKFSYKSFENTSYPCYWLGEDRVLWMNQSARNAPLPLSNSEYMQKLLNTAYLNAAREGTATTLPLLTDAMDPKELAVLPIDGGLFASAAQSSGASPMVAFSEQLREPLTNIFAVLPLLNRHLEDSDLPYTDEIQNNCYALLRLTANLESAARLERDSLKPKAIDLASLLDSVVVCVESICREQNIPIEKAIPSHPIPVRADSRLLLEAILNVVRNALQYTQDGNVIRIALSEKNGRAILTIEDKGLGIQPENLPHIFDAYFSADPYGDSFHRPGIGLGLSVTREAIQRFGGTVTAESRFGEGTRIHISLPVDEGEDEMLSSDPADYLLNRYSPLYIQLCGYCRLMAP